ncbi:uncharacterized protein CMU_002870 [Cryptosporidium muris RN66]|uniref:Uncharacterized protein n=1 Tax=Cryptosporidium muris (strain RN66) TaxID=441375 RepID=B6AJR6_CRYMR|nr:uncharacterized protein CMU_002870 [Cryptosporidium muris RN66]EEA08457.1 hypothetical protein, conserved [Cryptosporidium muris RN66]|eukprot:XP_002142806.1 hypothetical protein [Cryptosporidium muris RN66]
MNFDSMNRTFGGYNVDDTNEGGFVMMDPNDTLLQGNFDRKPIISHEQRLAPLKVGMILKSYSGFITNSRLQLLNREINLFKLVGFVRCAEHEEYPQRVRFYLDDGSGLILIDWLIDNTGTNYKQELINSITEGCFVKVYGELTLMVSEPSVRAFVVRPLVCTDEISAHDIDVAVFIVRCLYGSSTEDTTVANTSFLTKQTGQNLGEFNTNNNLKQPVVPAIFISNIQSNNNNNNNNIQSSGIMNNQSNNQNISMNRPLAAVTSVITPKTQFSNGSNLSIMNPLKMREVVCSILENASNEGQPEMSLEDIIESLNKRNITTTQDEVRGHLKNLVGEAKVYQTNPYKWRATGY